MNTYKQTKRCSIPGCKNATTYKTCWDHKDTVVVTKPCPVKGCKNVINDQYLTCWDHKGFPSASLWEPECKHFNKQVLESTLVNNTLINKPVQKIVWPNLKCVVCKQHVAAYIKEIGYCWEHYTEVTANNKEIEKAYQCKTLGIDHLTKIVKDSTPEEIADAYSRDY